MPIRDEKTYAKMSYKDFIVATERAKNGELKLAAFRAYKAERRMLQCLAMIHDLHRKDTHCAVPKNEMLEVSQKLQKNYPEIDQMTQKALKLFDEWKNDNANYEDIVSLLKSLKYEWIKQFLSDEDLEKIQKYMASL